MCPPVGVALSRATIHDTKARHSRENVAHSAFALFLELNTAKKVPKPSPSVLFKARNARTLPCNDHRVQCGRGSSQDDSSFESIAR